MEMEINRIFATVGNICTTFVHMARIPARQKLQFINRSYVGELKSNFGLQGGGLRSTVHNASKKSWYVTKIRNGPPPPPPSHTHL